MTDTTNGTQGVTETPKFWGQPATQWDIFKFFLPLLLACVYWAVKVEVNQARNDFRFDALTATMKQQNDTLRDIQESIKSLNENKSANGSRLASIETMLQFLVKGPK